MLNIFLIVFVDIKLYYYLLDGFWGVVVFMVIWYYVFEGYVFVGGIIIDIFNYGYLVVDFFFIFLGFVIGYVYDDCWGKNFIMKDFIKCCLICFYLMVIMGVIVGVIIFYIQGFV